MTNRALIQRILIDAVIAIYIYSHENHLSVLVLFRAIRESIYADIYVISKMNAGITESPAKWNGCLLRTRSYRFYKLSKVHLTIYRVYSHAHSMMNDGSTKYPRGTSLFSKRVFYTTSMRNIYLIKLINACTMCVHGDLLDCVRFQMLMSSENYVLVASLPRESVHTHRYTGKVRPPDYIIYRKNCNVLHKSEINWFV